MRRMLAVVMGGVTCADGVLGLAAPKAWSNLWRGVGALFPGETEEYFSGVMDLTDRYRERSPAGLQVMYGLEVASGLVVLMLALGRKF